MIDQEGDKTIRMLPVVSPVSLCSMDMFLKIKHAMPNASLISQCWLSKGLEMTNHFTISQHNITKSVMYQIEISSLIYLNWSQLEN